MFRSNDLHTVRYHDSDSPIAHHNKSTSSYIWWSSFMGKCKTDYYCLFHYVCGMLWSNYSGLLDKDYVSGLYIVKYIFYHIKTIVTMLKVILKCIFFLLLKVLHAVQFLCLLYKYVTCLWFEDQKDPNDCIWSKKHILMFLLWRIMSLYMHYAMSLKHIK